MDTNALLVLADWIQMVKRTDTNVMMDYEFDIGWVSLFI